MKIVTPIAVVAVTLASVLASPAAAKDYKLGASARSGDLIFTVYGYMDPGIYRATRESIRCPGATTSSWTSG